MAKCKFCGAEVTIGERCTYCGSKAEGWYYSGEEKKQEPKKKKASHDRVRDLFNGKIYIVKKGDLRVTDMSIIDHLDTVEPHFI